MFSSRRSRFLILLGWGLPAASFACVEALGAPAVSTLRLQFLSRSSLSGWACGMLRLYRAFGCAFLDGAQGMRTVPFSSVAPLALPEMPTLAVFEKLVWHAKLDCSLTLL
jgi:hypothetical protein